MPEIPLPAAGRQSLSQPRKTLFNVLKKLSHPKQWEGFSEDKERKLGLTQDLPVVQ